MLLPRKLTTIGERAFAGCTDLSEILLPKILKSIGAHAFKGCVKLSGIRIPDRTTEIGEQAFGYDVSGMPIPDFVLCGKSGSMAENYARINGFPFTES